MYACLGFFPSNHPGYLVGLTQIDVSVSDGIVCIFCVSDCFLKLGTHWGLVTQYMYCNNCVRLLPNSRYSTYEKNKIHDLEGNSIDKH